MVVTKVKGGYRVKSHKKDKFLSKRFKTKAEVVRRLRQILYFKNKV